MPKRLSATNGVLAFAMHRKRPFEDAVEPASPARGTVPAAE